MNTRTPWSRTRTLSMFRTMAMRWAIVTTVISLHSLEIVFTIIDAVWVSTLAVHSSRQSICRNRWPWWGESEVIKCLLLIIDWEGRVYLGRFEKCTRKAYELPLSHWKWPAGFLHPGVQTPSRRYVFLDMAFMESFPNHGVTCQAKRVKIIPESSEDESKETSVVKSKKIR